MFHIVLYHPEIPANTGNIIRLCANTGAHLHLIEPLGFNLDDKHLRRAGLDYHDLAVVCRHPSLLDCAQTLPGHRWFPCTTRGLTLYHQPTYQAGDIFLFGPETQGLRDILNDFPPDNWLRIPMQPSTRSLNLSNSVAVIVYEAWRQHSFAGGNSGQS